MNTPIYFQPEQNKDGNIIGHETEYHTNFLYWKSKEKLLQEYPNCRIVETEIVTEEFEFAD